MTIPENKELMEAYEKIQEAEMAGAPKDAGSTDGYGDGGTVPVGGGGTVKNERDQGATDAPKEFDGEGDKQPDPSDNEREAGAEEAPSVFEGSEESANDATTEKRDAGSKEAPHKYETVDAFRQRMRERFGLPLNAKINQGNDGIQA